MKTDLNNVDDIRKVIARFYSKVKEDATIGFFFGAMAGDDWHRHEEVMCAFWENVLFHTGSYSGNPLATHRVINQANPVLPAHFSRWLALFNETVDALFSGQNAQKMKDHARGIAGIMQQKM